MLGGDCSADRPIDRRILRSDSSSYAGVATGTGTGARRKTVYTITEDGERLFLELLQEPPQEGQTEDVRFRMRVAFFRYLPPETRVRLLERRRQALQERFERTEKGVPHLYDLSVAYEIEGEGIAILSALDLNQRVMSDSGKPSGDDYLLKVDNPLVVPVNKIVRIQTTGADVIHAFALPSFGIKIDANPGAVTNTGVTPTELGTYNIRCAELCGLHHAYMETTITVVTEDEYNAWVRENGGKRMA